MHFWFRGAVLLCAIVVLSATIPTRALAQSFSLQIDALGTTTAPAGVLQTIHGTITNAVSIPTVTVTFGDGTSAIVPVTQVPGVPGEFTFLIDHTYTANGTFTLKLTASDQGVTQHAQTSVLVFGIGGGGGGPQPTISSLTAVPSVPVWGQSVTFSAQVTNLPTPDWNWLWQFQFGGATVVDNNQGSALKTGTTVFSTPGSYFVTFTSDTTPPAGGFDPLASTTVQVLGRTETVAVNCGTPIFGLPTTLTATLTDTSDPASAAAALTGRTIFFVVNGAVVGSAQTGTPVTPTTSMATLPFTVTTLPGDTFTCAGFVADNALVPLFDVVGGPIIGFTLPALPPGVPGFLPIGTTISALGVLTIPGVGVFTPPGMVTTVLNGIGKVTGDPRLADGTRASFEVESKDGRTVKGNLEFKSPTVDFKATSFYALGITPDGRMAIFAGTGLTSGKSPSTVHFLVQVTDKDEPKNSDKRSDTFFITFTGGANGAAAGPVTHGNVEIHTGSGENRADGGKIG